MKIAKRIVLLLIALVILFSTAKSLNIQKNGNILEGLKNNQTTDKTEKTSEEVPLDNSTSNEIEKNNFTEISSQHEGISVISQEDQIRNDYYGYVINSISKSKKLGDFQNPYNILGHVDEQGDTIGAYSYLIINMTIECYQEFPELYLNTMKIFLYKGTELAQGYEAVTSNNTASMSSKSGMRCIMKKGEVKDINIVYLVEDEYIEDTDIYLFINNMGASAGDDIENKRLIKLDTKEAF